MNIQRQRLPDIREQGQPLKHSALSTDKDLTGPPLDIPEFEGDHFPGSKA